MFRLFSLLKIPVQLGFIMLYSIFIIEDMAKLMENVSRIEETIIASSTAVVDFSTNVVTICHRENTFSFFVGVQNSAFMSTSLCRTGEDLVFRSPMTSTYSMVLESCCTIAMAVAT
jgi:hypothetical protein